MIRHHACLALLMLVALAGCALESTASPTTDADAPSPDAAIVDAPAVAVDVPTVDAPPTADAPDVPIPVDAPPACTLPMQRTITLPSDRLTGRPVAGDPGVAVWQGCTGWDGYGPATLRAEPRTHVYAMRVERRVGVRLRSAASGWFIAVRRRCDDPRTTEACDLIRAEISAVLDPGEYSVLLTSGRSEPDAAYDVAVSTFAPEPTAWCETAAELSPGAPVRLDRVATGGGLGSPGCSTLETPQRYVAVTVPARHRAVVEVASFRQENPVPAWSPWRPFLRAYSGCGAAECLGAAPMTLLLDNHGDAPRRMIVGAGSREHPVYGTGDAELAVRFEPVADPGVASFCAAPTTVADGDRLPRQDTARGAELVACDRGSTGRALFYAATVPAGGTLVASVARAVATSAVPFAVRFLDDCAATACLAYSLTVGSPEVAQWTNPGAEPRRVVFVIAGPSGTTFDLDVAVRAPPVHGSCDAALALRDGERRRFELVSQGGSGPRCYGGRTRALYYRVAVPPGRRLTVTAAPVGESRYVNLALLRACDEATCLAQDFDSSSAEPRRLEYANASDSEETIVVAVASSIGTLADVSVSLTP